MQRPRRRGRAPSRAHSQRRRTPRCRGGPSSALPPGQPAAAEAGAAAAELPSPGPVVVPDLHPSRCAKRARLPPRGCTAQPAPVLVARAGGPAFGSGDRVAVDAAARGVVQQSAAAGSASRRRCHRCCLRFGSVMRGESRAIIYSARCSSPSRDRRASGKTSARSGPIGCSAQSLQARWCLKRHGVWMFHTLRLHSVTSYSQPRGQ